MKRFSELSAPRRNLVHIMQQLNFGKIKCVVASGCEPKFGRAPLFQKNFKPGGDNGVRPEATLSDYELKRPIVDLLRFFDRHGDLKITAIKVQHGLPVEFSVSLILKNLKKVSPHRAQNR